ncbi:grpE protein homolog 2, mitochondrial isoform X2 [Bombina bombina]|uniref:grpE protein homolog 2, mitochondrial isoform X2 n=1 Tax=Bombina bombina TaxID=8345 RepID=UPI00235A51AD|nr:grpE protein homolog 2, mitochondrial isoform X2 [Bombina bombina]
MAGLKQGVIMAGLTLRTAADQLGALLSMSARQYRCSACVLSTAAQQRSEGDQTTADDGPDDHLYTVRTLERKALKLEEEERCRRALADSENVRKRTQKFVEDAKLFGIQSFCRDLVEVADILEKAVEQAAEGGVKDILYQVDGKLQDVFMKHGLQKMTPVGGEYDPYAHEIVSHVPIEGIKPGTVATVRQVGYKLHGRTIRHAHVGVAVETNK